MLKKQKPLTKKSIAKAQTTSTNKSLKEAYQIVRQDLFNRLLKAKNNQTVWLPDIGTFTKRKQQSTSGLDNETYLYYKIGFRMSAPLKRELERSLLTFGKGK